MKCDVALDRLSSLSEAHVQGHHDNETYYDCNRGQTAIATARRGMIQESEENVNNIVVLVLELSISSVIVKMDKVLRF